MPHGSKGKQMAKVDVMDKDKRPGKLIMSTRQKELWEHIKKYVKTRTDAPLDIPRHLPAKDRKFVLELVDSLHLQWNIVENDAGERHLQLTFPRKMGDYDDEEEEDEESLLAILRVVKQYDNAPVVDVSAGEAQVKMTRPSSRNGRTSTIAVSSSGIAKTRQS